MSEVSSKITDVKATKGAKAPTSAPAAATPPKRSRTPNAAPAAPPAPTKAAPPVASNRGRAPTKVKGGTYSDVKAAAKKKLAEAKEAKRNAKAGLDQAAAVLTQAKKNVVATNKAHGKLISEPNVDKVQQKNLLTSITAEVKTVAGEESKATKDVKTAQAAFDKAALAVTNAEAKIIDIEQQKLAARAA